MIITKKDFCDYVEEAFILSDNTMIDTVLEACERFKVDPNLVEPLINRSLKEKLEKEYIRMHYIKSDTNPLF